MSRERALAGVALAAAAGVTALAVVLVARDGDGGRSSERIPPVEARGLLSPRIALFGDTVTARVDVTLDRRRADPDSVRVTADFAPWVAVGSPAREQRDGETTTHLRTTFRLRCLAGPCAPTRGPLRLEFEPATVTYGSRRTLEVAWPVLEVHSRLDPAALARPDAGGPWRAELVSLPAVSYRVEPGAALVVLLTGGTLLGLVGLVVGYLALPKRRPKPAPPPVLPEPSVTPVERALALLESPAPADGAVDRRRALEFIGAELAAHGHEQLARRARELAWSEAVPAPEETRGLVARVRAVLRIGGEDPRA